MKNPILFIPLLASIPMLTAQNVRLEGTATRIICTGSPVIIMNNMGWTNNASGTALTAGNSEVRLTGNGSSNVSTNNAYRTTFYNLEINKTGGSEINFVSNNMDIVVSNTLEMVSGNVDMNNNLGSNLTLGSGTANLGTLSRTSGHVYNGFFQKWYNGSAVGADNSTSEFPLGMNASSYNFARIFFTSAPGAGGTLRMRFVASNPMWGNLPLTDNTNTGACGAPVTINNAANEGYWEIIPANGMPSTGTYTSRLCYNNFSSTGAPNCLRVIKSEDHLVWMQEGTHGAVDNVTTFSVTRSGQTGYSWFTIGGDININPLPVELTSFDASCTEQSILLTWSTASEQNNAYFTLERSKDAVIWETVTTLPGAGNSNTSLQYQFSDPVYNTGYYYRLSQTDFNNESESFSPVYVNCGQENTGTDLINAYNGHSGEITVVFEAAAGKDYVLDIYDMRGRKLNRKSGTASEGMNQVQVDAGAFSGAIYLVTLTAGGESISRKFLVQ